MDSTTMTNLTTFQSIQTELKVNKQGKAFCSMRGAARLAGVDQSALVQSLKTSEGINPSKLATMLINKGFEHDEINEIGIPDIALEVILEYYAFHAGARCTQQAQNMLVAFNYLFH